MGKIKTGYDKHLGNMKRFYEQEIDELKDEIKRQYKVIGMMKQEVEDLMMLLNETQLSKTKELKEELKEINQTEKERRLVN